MEWSGRNNFSLKGADKKKHRKLCVGLPIYMLPVDRSVSSLRAYLCPSNDLSGDSFCHRNIVLFASCNQYMNTITGCEIELIRTIIGKSRSTSVPFQYLPASMDQLSICIRLLSRNAVLPAASADSDISYR